MAVPLPLAYVAFRSTLPVSSSSNGPPVTVTSLLNVTLMPITSPFVYVPLSLVAATFKTTAGTSRTGSTGSGAIFAVPNRVRWYV